MSGHSQFNLLSQRRFLPYFIVQGLGAFNDNVYRQAIIGLLAFMAVGSAQMGLYANLAPAIFILPFFLFSASAGQIAERLEKQKLIVITTSMEIAIMSLAAVGFLLQNMTVLLVALFCTGMQSTLFGPVKYSILPSVLKPEELTGGNGLVEMGTSLSILIGMIFGGLIFQLAGAHGPQVAAVSVVLMAIAGNLVARRIPKVDAGNPELKVDWNVLRVSLQIWQLTRQRLAVRNAVLGVSWFWFVGTILTAQLPVYAQDNLGGTQNLYIFALALFSVGAGIGSMSCEKLSGRTVEIGLVPLGALGISAFLLDLYFARPGQALAQGLTISQFISAPGSWRIVMDLVGVGLFTGFFVVPLFALIQSRTPRTELARVIAGMNIQNAMFIVLAALIGIFVQRVLGWTIPQLFLALAIANTLVALWIFTIVPEFLMRFLCWLMVRSLYRLKLHGIEANVPDEGAALLVCNHVSFMDALVLGACIPRPARFVMYYKIFNIPVLRWIFKTAKTIPIAGAREDPEVMARAFDAVDAALAEGELVCIFPEGALTPDGQIAPFRPGMEKIMQRAAARGQQVPVVPLALKNMWGSMWSNRDSRLHRARLPRRLWAKIEVLAGVPVPASEASASLLEGKVKALRGDAA